VRVFPYTLGTCHPWQQPVRSGSRANADALPNRSVAHHEQASILAGMGNVVGALPWTVILATGALGLGCSLQLDSPDATIAVQSEAVRLTAGDDAQLNAQLGYEVALHGTSMLGAAPFQTNGEGVEAAGIVHLFTLEQGVWSRTPIEASYADVDDGRSDGAELPDDVVPPSTFSAMSVQLDDELIIVGWGSEDGASQHDRTDNSLHNSGAVLVYSRANLEAEPQYLKAISPGKLDHFGVQTALSDQWLAVGATGESSASRDDPFDDSAEHAGAVYVYERRAGRFSNPRYLKAPTPRQGDMFGSAVALSGDLLVVGAFAEDGTRLDGEPALAIGAAYVFRWKNDEWALEARLEPTNRLLWRSHFGVSLSISGDTIAIGASGATGCADEKAEDGLLPGRGAVYIANRHETGWNVDACLSPAGSDPLEAFGYNLGLSGDRLAVAGPWDSETTPCDLNADIFDLDWHNCGAAYLFHRDEQGDWGAPDVLYPPAPRAGFVYGQSVAISDDLLVVSSPQESVRTSDGEPRDQSVAGALYVYPLAAGPL
jgi:hypothetical protein